MNREVGIWFHENFQDVTGGITSTHVTNAIGYLVMWASHSERYCKLSLYGDKEGNLNATYRNKEGDVTYSIFGLRADDGSYSFHS